MLGFTVPHLSLKQPVMCFTGKSALSGLTVAARRRMGRAFRPGTKQNLRVHLKTFVSFCLHFKEDYLNPTVHIICLYIEFLAQSFKSHQAVRNYIHGLRTAFKCMNMDVENFNAFEVHMMLRAVSISMEHVPRPALPLSEETLLQLVRACTALGPAGAVIKCALLFGFFGFLRRSNIAPYAGQTFDPSRHTCRGDVISHAPGLILILKWSKTLQTHDHQFLIPLPRLAASNPLCPVRAFADMCKVCPTRSSNQPLFTLPRSAAPSGKLLTSNLLAVIFKQLLLACGLNAAFYSLHSLRRGGATSSFRGGANVMHIKRHGTWRSDAFWRYIAQESILQSEVPQALARRAHAVL